MEWGIITGITGTIIGASGLTVAIIANSQAKKANQLSKTSNEISRQALNTAVESNEIAENANKFSQESNALFERQISQNSDDSHVEWKCDWDKEEAIIQIKNLGGNTAHDVSVIVTAENFHEVYNWKAVPANQIGVFIPFPDFIEMRKAHNARAIDFMNRNTANGIFIGARLYKRNFNIVITWKSSLGVPNKFITEIKAT